MEVEGGGGKGAVGDWKRARQTSSSALVDIVGVDVRAGHQRDMHRHQGELGSINNRYRYMGWKGGGLEGDVRGTYHEGTTSHQFSPTQQERHCRHLVSGLLVQPVQTVF
jgi:hypothetical protein